MNAVLNIILAFYPTALIWSFLPHDWLVKLDSFGSSNFMHFALRFIVFALFFFISYRVIQKFISSRFSYSRKGALSILLAVVSLVLILLIIFYQILPGADLYKAPAWVSEYILKIPFSFFAVLIPVAYLFFD